MPASYLVRIHLRKGTVPFQNDFHFLTTAPDGTYAEALEIANAVQASTWFTSDYIALLPSDVTVEFITAQSFVAVGGSTVSSPTAVLPDGTVGGRVPATGTGQTSNQNGPFVTYFPESLPGERARACKVFIPTINESDGEDDQVSGALLAILNTFITNLFAGMTVSSGPASWTAAVKIAGVSTLRSIMGAVGRGWIASQRRRRPKQLT